MLCWLSESPLDPRRKYLIRHTTRDSKAMLAGIALPRRHQHHGAAGGRAAADERHRPRQLQAGAADLRRPLRESRGTGAFIVIDESSNNTVGAGMISDGAALTVEAAGV
jgi:sulfate adenylyltransferase subunit 1